MPGSARHVAGEKPWADEPDHPGVRMRFFGESMDSGPWVMQIQFAPDYVEPKHWHEHDTIYIVIRGEMRVADEGTYRVGDLRWVRGRTFYGPETAGAEGCEFWLVSNGRIGIHYDPA